MATRDAACRRANPARKTRLSSSGKQETQPQQAALLGDTVQEPEERTRSRTPGQL